MGASSRLRSFQYFPYLESKNIQIEVAPLFGDDYLKGLYNGSRPFGVVIHSYYRRFIKILDVRNFDLVVIGDEVFPYLPALVERLFGLFKISYICDYDDAVYHNYDLHPSRVVRFLLGRKIAAVMRKSSAVTAGNSYLAAYARKAGARRVEVFPTVVDLERYSVKVPSTFSPPERPLVIGWIGTFSTFKYLKSVMPLLERISQGYPLELRVVGPSADLKSTIPINFIPWSEATEAESIKGFDVGIMPLDDTPWERGKCGYKLIQYMASGIPVIARGIGVNKEIVDHGINGFIANSDEEWREALVYLASHRKRLAEMGSAGRKIVAERYSLQITREKLLNLVHELTD